MNNFIKLNIIEKESNTLIYHFTCSPDLSKYFNENENFKIEYDLSGLNIDEKISSIPDAVLVIPFLGNVLPISWLTNSKLVIPEIDKNFYDSIPNIKKGFQDMYPNLQFEGEIHVDKVIECSRVKTKNNNPLAFFSAGVDAWQTLCDHFNEKPVLLTMFGADFYLENAKGNEAIANHMKQIAEQFDCECVLFNTNLRKFINEDMLNQTFAKKLGFHWWHRIQHGLGVITHSAPIAYLKNSQHVYFASSYSFKDKIRHKCATDPQIDNHIKFANAQVIHDGYEYSRQDKIYNICNFSKKYNKQIFIHVCWKQFDNIQNCSYCEKCMRTWVGIIAEGFNPNDFGFEYKKEISSKFVYKLLTSKKQELTEEMWEQIFNRFKMNAGIINIYPEFKWVLNFNFAEQKYNKNKDTKKHHHKTFNILGIKISIKKKK